MRTCEPAFAVLSFESHPATYGYEAIIGDGAGITVRAELVSKMSVSSLLFIHRMLKFNEQGKENNQSHKRNRNLV